MIKMSLFNFLKLKFDRCLGIDIGTAVLKIVELKKEKNKLRLENYGLASPELPETGSTFRTTDLSVQDLSQLIKQILTEAKIQTRKAVISLPILSSFSVLINLPRLSDKELAATIPFEVKKYIPVPMGEVMLNWSIVGQTSDYSTLESIKRTDSKDKIQILVVAVPREIINKYTQVAKMAGLDILALEQEAFSLSRSLIGNDTSLYLIVDIGSRGSSVIVVDGGTIRLSHTLEKIDKQSVCEEIKKVVDIYRKWHNKSIKNCILVGNLEKSDVDNFLPDCLVDMETVIGNPLARVEYLPQLESVLKEIKPLLVVAIGLAMREL